MTSGLGAEAVNEFGAPARAAETSPIKARSAAPAPAMASLGNAESRRWGGPSGRAGLVRGFAALVLLSAGSAQALEPLRSYDNFGSPPLDPARWTTAERVIEIERGALRLMQRNWSSTAADTGSTPFSWSENLTDPAAVTALKAKITVHALEANACAGNTATALARARIAGAFFNAGTPTPGSAVGDVLAQVRLVRASNSTDPAGVLRVQGIASICGDAPCNATTPIGSTVDLGTVNIGQATTVQLQWDQPAKTFLFTRIDTGASGAVVYTVGDGTSPSSPFKQLGTRMEVPNCQTGAPVSGLVDASFDNVAVNRSAAP